jgi:hypothetical protein
MRRELGGASSSMRQASRGDQRERDEKSSDHESVMVVRVRREPVERLAVFAECIPARYQHKNSEQRSDCSESRTGERGAGEVEREQGDRYCAAQAVDPDRCRAGVQTPFPRWAIARRDDHSRCAQHDRDPEHKAHSPCPRPPRPSFLPIGERPSGLWLPPFLVIAEGTENAVPDQAEHPSADHVHIAHTNRVCLCPYRSVNPSGRQTGSGRSTESGRPAEAGAPEAGLEPASL